MDGFAFLRAEQIWRGAACSVLLQRCRGKRAAARWLRRGEQYFTGEKLWVDVVTGSPVAGGGLLNRFALTTSVCRVLFFFFFSGLVILKGIDFNVFSLDGDLTAEESAPRRNGVPWSFTSACLHWKLWLSVVPGESFVDEKRSLDPSHASAERGTRLFGELLSSPWAGAILSETISNIARNSHGRCTAPWQRTDLEVHKLSGYL